MNNGMFKLNWANIKSAIVYGVLTAIMVFIVSVLEGIKAHGSIFGVDWKGIIDTGIIATMGLIISIVSIVKNLLTTNQGKFLGITTVIPDKK
jgi:hypothetical protein